MIEEKKPAPKEVSNIFCSVCRQLTCKTKVLVEFIGPWFNSKKWGTTIQVIFPGGSIAHVPELPRAIEIEISILTISNDFGTGDISVVLALISNASLHIFNLCRTIYTPIYIYPGQANFCYMSLQNPSNCLLEKHRLRVTYSARSLPFQGRVTLLSGSTFFPSKFFGLQKK